MAPEETGKDAQNDENNTMAQKHLHVVFAADIEEAAAFELLNNLCHSSPERLNFYRCSQIPPAAWQKLRGASWTNLREANFEGCLVLQTWLQCLDMFGLFHPPRGAVYPHSSLLRTPPSCVVACVDTRWMSP